MSITATQDIAWEIESGSTLGKITATRTLSWPINQTFGDLGGSAPITWAVGASDETTVVSVTGAPTGLIGTITVSLITEDGSITVLLPTTQGIQEIPANSGRYTATITRPAVGHYFIVWTDGTTTTFSRLEVFRDKHWEVDFDDRWVRA